MSHKLTDTQLTLLSTAAQRADRFLAPGDNVKPAARTKIASKLLALGLIEEVRAGLDSPVWRREEEGAVALRITKEGGAAIGVELSEETGAAVADGSKLSREPRAGSKLAGVIALLARADGASLAELVAATDWLPHTTRAALTGLRRRGYALARETSEGRGSVYRIAENETAAA